MNPARESLSKWVSRELESRPTRRELRVWVKDLLDLLDLTEYENACRAAIVAANKRLTAQRNAADAEREKCGQTNRRLRGEIERVRAQRDEAMASLRVEMAKTAPPITKPPSMNESEIVRDKRRVLEYLRSSRRFMPYLHESMPASGAEKLLGSRDRAQRALVALVQDQKITYLENCSPDHYQAYADLPPAPALITES